ncbi:MAG: hypothetical protein IM547_01645 [Chitinophagaceae bacterium]|nr:hypothetical protein [Chitinophagaceae bacterium]
MIDRLHAPLTPADEETLRQRLALLENRRVRIVLSHGYMPALNSVLAGGYLEDAAVGLHRLVSIGMSDMPTTKQEWVEMYDTVEVALHRVLGEVAKGRAVMEKELGNKE